MRPSITPKCLCLFLLLLLLPLLSFASPAVQATADEDSADDRNSRVARITVVRGDVQIRRADSQEWEEAAPNLPLVEGDRLATGQDSRVEIQFDRDNYLRLAEDSILKIVTLNENGAAISLPEGTLSLKLGNFTSKRDSFEIDAPRTTIAVEREGRYRVDAPQGSHASELKVTVADGGQARIYSATSGYTVRSGRTARIFLAGEYAGDIDFTGALNNDDFDDWAAAREDSLTRSSRDEYRAHYDSDIYGADDLNDYGEWINSSRYGWVWRPYRSSTASYDNWSPYRYGHWRYVPGYGWTWIADESWGWATSHYGRWVYLDDGGWSWCPSERENRRRSRWQAALVVFINIGRNICWYPLPYDYHYSYNYRSRTIIYNNTTIINNPPRDPTRRPMPHDSHKISPLPVSDESQTTGVYATAVTQMPLDRFGKFRKGITPATELDSRRAINSLKSEIRFDLPVYSDNDDARVVKEREITEKRVTLKEADRELEANNSKIGAMPRARGATLNDKLREDRVFKGRPSTVIRNDSTDAQTEKVNQPRTGVFDRQPRIREKRDESDLNNNEVKVKARDDVFERPSPRRQTKLPNRVENADRSDDARPRVKTSDRDDSAKPTEQPRPRPRQKEEREERENDNNNRRLPTYQVPRQKEPERRPEPRPESPQRREEPRFEPPKQRDEPRVEPPSKREEPKPEKRETPPVVGRPGKSIKDSK